MMNKILIVVVCLMISTWLVSCQQLEESTIQSSTTMESVDTENQPTYEDYFYYVLKLRSYEEVTSFMLAATGTIAEYEQYVTNPDNGVQVYVTHDIALKIVDNMTSLALPTVIGESTDSSFWATYYLNQDRMEWNHSVDGVLYQFIYQYNDTNGYTYEGEPVLNDIPFGNDTIDIYQGDGRFVGAVVNGTTTIKVVVHTDEVSDVSFDMFEFKTISSSNLLG